MSTSTMTSSSASAFLPNATTTSESLIFDLLEKECGGVERLPYWLTAEAFYDPAVMLLLAVLA